MDASGPFNVTTYFLDRNLEEGRGQNVALIVGDRRVTYDELAHLTNRVGNALRGLGVRREERVLLALSDGVEFVATWYAALKIGAVVAEAYTFLQPKDYEYFLNYSGAGVVVADAQTLEKIRSVRPQCPHLRQILVVGVAELNEGETSFELSVEAAPQELEPVPTTGDDIGIWKFTTGSTGAPKAAVHTHAHPLVCFEQYALQVIGYREEDRVLPVPKLFFGYARDAATLFTFGVGATGVIFPGRSTPGLLFDLIEKHSPTVVVQVPTMMAQMLAEPDAEERDLSSLRLCISSGETLPGELHRRWLETFGVEVIEGVGSSELYYIYLSNRPGSARMGSAGHVVPGYRARLIDERGADVPDNETGELWISGASSALMYWGDPERSQRTFVDGWVRTGDLFARKPDGTFWYRGRADDLLKVGGIWVAPIEIENCLLEHPGVIECAVVGYEDAGLVLPRAYVVTRGASDADLAGELVEFTRARLAPHKAPRDVRFVSALPKTASGKVDRRRLSAEGLELIQ